MAELATGITGENARVATATGQSAGTSQFLTMADLARRWQVTLEGIRSMRKRGKLPPAFPLPMRVVRWRLSDIEQFEKNCLAKIRRGDGFPIKSTRAFP